MRRRVLLALLGATALPAAGCASRSGTGPDDTATATGPSDADGTPTASDADPIELVVSNGAEAARAVAVVVSADERVISEHELTLAAGERTAVRGGIETPGEYVLTADIDDGPTEAFDLDVEDYDVRTGADRVLRVDGDGIRLLVEE